MKGFSRPLGVGLRGVEVARRDAATVGRRARSHVDTARALEEAGMPGGGRRPATAATSGRASREGSLPAGWRHSQARSRAGDHQTIEEALMASDARERAARGAEAATGRIRDLNEQILERFKSGGESALEAY